ncbi:MAG: Rne/Rng family ribonuclease [Bacillota bacterium]|nr:Rne/Rng family ribonuclease [Bacillota bacterium]
MKKEIIVDINHFQTRAALLQDGKLMEIYVERSDKERITGNIYKGRVDNVLPGMQAAFVDIGLGKNAFLYAGDILVDKMDFEFDDGSPDVSLGNIKDMVKTGQEIIVQVVKEALGTKGARLTTHITLPGRLVVLMPTVDHIGVSRRIEDESERHRLKTEVEKIKPKKMGVILRTMAQGKTAADMGPEIRLLTRHWEKIQSKAKTVSAPRLLHAERDLLFRIVRDMFNENVDRMVVSDREHYERVCEIADIVSPHISKKIELFQQQCDIFEYYGLEPQMEALLERKVWLKSGGYIIIDQTEAMTVIDVNTGKFVGHSNLEDTILRINLEAAQEIARQLRLRDISGIIIIDFIDMDLIVNREKVLDTLREALREDRTKSNVLGITGLGLVEMTRKKMRHNLSSMMESTCSCCRGSGRTRSPLTMALKVRKEVQKNFEHTDFPNFLIEVHPEVVKELDKRQGEDNPILPAAAGRRLFVRACPDMHIEQVNIRGFHKADEMDSLTDVKAY